MGMHILGECNNEQILEKEISFQRILKYEIPVCDSCFIKEVHFVVFSETTYILFVLILNSKH